MLGVDYHKIILLSTTFPTIPMLGTTCLCKVILFYVEINDVVSCKTSIGVTGNNTVTVGLHQGSPLSRYMFDIVLIWL